VIQVQFDLHLKITLFFQPNSAQTRGGQGQFTCYNSFWHLQWIESEIIQTLTIVHK